ncbi:MAG: signal peptidase I [Sphingomonas bacterium]|nr:signal peptidase I [Sphingomonas bacterium]
MAKTPPAAKSETRETLSFLLRLAIIVFVIRSFVFASFFIPSESMLPRLLVGDFLFVSKWNYGYSRWSLPWGLPLIPGRILPHTPDRGDVVVFRSPGPDDHDVIKRVIGLPGDTIQMRRGQLWLNGKAIPKQRVADFVLPLTPNFPATLCDPAFQDTDATGQAICRYPRFRETLPDGKSYDVLDQRDIPQADDTDVYTVPAGDVFLMGDNRDDSADSRFAYPEGMGYIPMERIEGKAVVTFFSTNGSAEWIKPWTWFSAARPDRIGEGF